MSDKAEGQCRNEAASQRQDEIEFVHDQTVL